MSAHVDDLLFDDDDDDDMGGVEAMQGFVHPPATLLQPPASIVQPPASLVQPPASLVQPPASLVPPPASLVQPPASLVQPPPSLIQPPASIGITAPPIAASPIAYQPSPPTQALPDDKLRKLFQIIQTRIKDKYVPIYNEVKAQGTPLKSDMTAILEVVKKHIGEPMLMSLMQEIGGFPVRAYVNGPPCNPTPVSSY